MDIRPCHPEALLDLHPEQSERLPHPEHSDLHPDLPPDLHQEFWDFRESMQSRAIRQPVHVLPPTMRSAKARGRVLGLRLIRVSATCPYPAIRTTRIRARSSGLHWIAFLPFLDFMITFLMGELAVNKKNATDKTSFGAVYQTQDQTRTPMVLLEEAEDSCSSGTWARGPLTSTQAPKLWRTSHGHRKLGTWRSSTTS